MQPKNLAARAAPSGRGHGPAAGAGAGQSAHSLGQGYGSASRTSQSHTAIKDIICGIPVGGSTSTTATSLNDRRSFTVDGNNDSSPVADELFMPPAQMAEAARGRLARARKNAELQEYFMSPTQMSNEAQTKYTASPESPSEDEDFMSPAQMSTIVRRNTLREKRRRDLEEHFISPAKMFQVGIQNPCSVKIESPAVDAYFPSPAQMFKLAKDKFGDGSKSPGSDMVVIDVPDTNLTFVTPPIQVLKKVLDKYHSHQEEFAAEKDGVSSSPYLLSGYAKNGVGQENGAVAEAFSPRWKMQEEAQNSDGEKTPVPDDIPFLSLDTKTSSSPTTQQPPTPVLSPVTGRAKSRFEKIGDFVTSWISPADEGQQTPSKNKPVALDHQREFDKWDSDGEEVEVYYLRPPEPLSYLEQNWTSREAADKLQSSIDRVWEKLPDVYEYFTGLEGVTNEVDESAVPEMIEDVLRETRSFRIWVKDNKLRAKEHPEIRGIVHDLESWVLDQLRTLREIKKRVAADKDLRLVSGNPNLQRVHRSFTYWAAQSFARGSNLIGKMEYFTQGPKHIPRSGLQKIEEDPTLEEKDQTGKDTGNPGSNSADTDQLDLGLFFASCEN